MLQWGWERGIPTTSQPERWGLSGWSGAGGGQGTQHGARSNYGPLATSGHAHPFISEPQAPARYNHGRAEQMSQGPYRPRIPGLTQGPRPGRVIF